MYASILSPGATLKHTLAPKATKAYGTPPPSLFFSFPTF